MKIDLPVLEIDITDEDHVNLTQPDGMGEGDSVITLHRFQVDLIKQLLDEQQDRQSSCRRHE